jgi:hypothetical protein
MDQSNIVKIGLFLALFLFFEPKISIMLHIFPKQTIKLRAAQ